MLRNTIILIVPYFGKLPWYFNFFVHSCKYNPNIHFLIITDDAYEGMHLPPNIFFIQQTFDEFKNAISVALEMDIKFNTAYKICDCKPTYGLVFKNHIKGYTFWGHCDIDLIFGCIETFISDDILDNNDVISIRPEYISGFFALYRNTETINHLFKSSKDYEKLFSSDQYIGFDECGMICKELGEGMKLEELNAKVDSMTHLVKRWTNQGRIRSYFDFHAVESVPGNMLWSKGSLFYLEYEILLYHLSSFKIHPSLEIPLWKSIPDQFIILEFSFRKIKCHD